MKLELHQGAYQARSPIASAQVCYNLVPEQNPPDAPFPVTHYPAPGLQLLSDYSSTFGDGTDARVRGLYQCSNGSVVAVVGTQILFWEGPGNTPTICGQMPETTNFNVSICDNQTDVVIVDGVSGMYAPINDMTGGFTQITDEAFFSSYRVDYIDTFMVFTQPASAIFYTTTSNTLLPFDPTYFAAKEGWNDLLVCAACLHDNIWLLGNTTAEIWFNAGGATFPFARMPNSILQQGCISVWSVVVADNALYWLSQDRWGRNMMMRGEGYAARRISTFAVEDEWSKYPTLADAIGMVYQLGGHETIGMYFPSGQAWWAYDASTQQWHKRTFSDLSTPWLPSCMCGYGATAFVTAQENMVLAGDRTGPRIYQVTRNAYTDNGTPIQRQRSWMHLQQDGQRIAYTRFALSMNGNFMTPDTVSLDWSDDSGQNYGLSVPQTTNGASNGQYLWRRLGYGRDRVYRATWSGQGEFALNGAYSDGEPQAT